MSLNINLPQHIDGDAGHTAGHNATNLAVNQIAAAVDALPLQWPAGARYVSPTGSDGNDGRSWATPLLTIAAAEAAVPAGGAILLAPGSHTLPATTLAHAKALIGPSRRVCTLTVPAGAVGSALHATSDGAVLRGFTIAAAAASATLTSAIDLGPGQILDDVVISGAPVAISSSAAGSARIGTQDTVEIYDHTGYAIDIDGDGGLETHFGKVTITRLASGNADGGIRVTRSTADDVGGIYLDAVVITAGSGTYDIGLDVRSTFAETRTPVRVGPLSVIDAAGLHSFYAEGIDLIDVTGTWMNTAPGGTKYAVKLIDCGAPLFVGALIVGTPAGGSFHITGGANPGIWNCVADNGTLITVDEGDPPTGIQFGGNRNYTTLTNDAETLVSAVQVTDNSGLAVLTSDTHGGGVFALRSAEGGAPKYLRVSAAGELQILNGDFSRVLVTLRDNGQILADGDMFFGGSATFYGPFFGVFGTAGTRVASTPTTLAEVIAVLQRHGIVP